MRMSFRVMHLKGPVACRNDTFGDVARGSHGMYQRTGRYTYKRIAKLYSLIDEMPTKSQGALLFNPALLQMYDQEGRNLITGKKPSWMKNIFRWGNQESGVCKVAGISLGVCQLENGPTGPLVKVFMNTVDRLEGR
jgi:hypothetical protein